MIRSVTILKKIYRHGILLLTQESRVYILVYLMHYNYAQSFENTILWIDAEIPVGILKDFIDSWRSSLRNLRRNFWKNPWRNRWECLMETLLECWNYCWVCPRYHVQILPVILPRISIEIPQVIFPDFSLFGTSLEIPTTKNLWRNHSKKFWRNIWRNQSIIFVGISAENTIVDSFSLS